MKQARTALSTYSADVFGVCSALFELGGMIVMHDASGCNSTYTTHDEPRWYHSDSLIFISGLTETDAILGSDEKLVGDMLRAIDELHPKFSAIAGTPIPMMTGFDYEAAAREIEEKSGIPCFGFATNGMRSYLCGASEALAALARRMTKEDVDKKRRSVNILGATPLDFSLSGAVQSIKKLLTESGWEVIGCWAMDSDLTALARAGEAAVNLVISGTGMKAALTLKEKFGTPFVVGVPIGEAFSQVVLEKLSRTELDGQDRIAFSEYEAEEDEKNIIIGESIISRSLAAAQTGKGKTPKVLYPLEDMPELCNILSSGDITARDEEEIILACRDAESVTADPLYKPIVPEGCRFIPLPHEAFSGRMFRKTIPDITNFC